jgi:hypothetical protein
MTLMIAACLGAIRIGGFRIGEVKKQWEPVYRDGCSAATRTGDLRALARLHVHMGAVCGNVLGSIADYVRYSREGVMIADQLGDPGLRCGTRAYLCFAAMYAGHFDEASRMADDIVDIAQGDVDLGADVAGWSPLIWSLAWRIVRPGLEGDPLTALRELPTVRQLAVQHGYDEMILWLFLTYESELIRIAGSDDALRRLAADCARAFTRVDARTGLNRIIASVLSSALNAADLKWGAALVDAREALRAQEAYGAHPGEASVFEHIARAQLSLGDPSAGRAAVAQGVSRMKESGSIYRPGVCGVLARAQLALHESAADIRPTLDEYESLLTRTGLRLLQGELHEIRAELAAREGATAERVQALKTAGALYAQMGLTAKANAMRDALSNSGPAP